MDKNEQITQSRLAAMKIAEIHETDREDMEICVSDMQKFASLDSDEARVVASAIRAKYLPVIAREAGIDDSKFFNLDEESETVDFADEKDEDMDEDMDDEDHDMDDDMEDDEDMEDDDMSDDDDDDVDLFDDKDEVEDKDEDVATFEIEVPADKLEAAQQAVHEALQSVLGEDSEIDFEEDMDSEDEMESDEDTESAMHKLSHEVNKMTKQTLAERRAYRENILKKIASEEEVYPSAEGVKTKAGNKGETDYPVMKLDGENSLKSENPTFVKTKVPTNNPDCLQTPGSVEAVKFEGGSGDLEVTVDWECIEEVPSEGGEKMEMFAVPTDMPMKHKTTVASKDKNCECCGYTKSEKTAGKGIDVHAVKCAQCDTKMAVCDKCIEADADCKYCKSAEKSDKKDEAVEAQAEAPAMIQQKEEVDEFKEDLTETQNALASINLARVKTSYSCASKLAIAGIISNEEVDAYAEQMLNDNLKSDAMIRQTKLLLKSAQSSAERVAAAAAEKMSVRTASTNGISTTPALSSSVLNSAAYDIQSALKGTWTMPKIED
jgi:hypothetical protein